MESLNIIHGPVDEILSDHGQKVKIVLRKTRFKIIVESRHKIKILIYSIII